MAFLVKQTSLPASSRGHSVFDLHREVDNIFGNFMRRFDVSPFSEASVEAASMAPRVDIAETDRDYQITAEMPGVDEKDLDVSLSKGLLTIRGEKKSEAEEKSKNFHRVERSYGMFERSIALPQDADPAKVDAEFKKGVLKVSVAKLPTAIPQKRKIEVKSS